MILKVLVRRFPRLLVQRFLVGEARVGSVCFFVFPLARSRLQLLNTPVLLLPVPTCSVDQSVGRRGRRRRHHELRHCSVRCRCGEQSPGGGGRGLGYLL